MHNVSFFMRCLTMLFAGFSFSAQAQLGIVTPYPAAAGGLTRGGSDTSLLTVKYTFGAAATSVTGQVLLPQGVAYVAGSVTKTAGTAGITVADGGGTSRTPTFSISGVTAPGDVTFTIKRTAGCGGTGSGKDTVKLSCGGCTTVTESDGQENPYNIYAPSLAVTPPATINGALPATNYSRTLTVTNGGNGCVDTVRFYLVYPSTGNLKLQDAPTNTLAAGGQNITPTSTSGDTLFYKIFGAAIGGDGRLCNGESISVTEAITVVNCTGSALTTQYGARWGTPASTCQTATASSLVNFATGTPSLTASITTQPPSIPHCAGTYTYSVTITNNGSAPASGMAVSVSNSNSLTTLGNNDRFFIDTASILITMPGGSPTHPTGISTTNGLFNVSTNPCIHNKPGRAVLTSLASAVLQPAQSIVVTWTVNTGCVTGTVCGGTNPTLGNMYCNATYQGVCGGTLFTMSNVGVRVGPTVGFTTGSEEYPAEVAEGQCFQMKYVVKPNLATGYNSTSAASLPRKYLQGAITLPTGVTFVSLAETNYGYDSTMHAGYPVQVGNQVIFRMNATSPLAATGAGSTASSVFRMRFNLCRAASGSTCGNNTISAEFSLTSDSACSPLIVAKDCRSSIVSFPCTGAVCTGGGTRSVRADMGRINFGLPDNNADGKPDSIGTLNMNKVEVNNYRPGDTMRSVSSAIIAAQTLPGNITAWNNAYAEWQFTPTNTSTLIWKPAAPATIFLTRGGTTYTCNSVSIDTLSSNSRYRLKIDTPCFQSLMPFLTDDSIRVVADFVYAPVVTGGGVASGTGGTHSINIGDYNNVTRTTVAHILYASQSAAPPVGGGLGTTGFTCDSRTYVAYVNGFRHDLGLGSASLSGCNAATLSPVSQTYANGLVQGGQFFPGEYRPLWIPDTIIYTVPAGWEYTGPTGLVTTFTYTTAYTYSTTYSPAFSILPIVTGSVSSGYTLLYDIKAAKQNGTMPFWGSEGVYLRTQFPVRPTCASAVTASFGMEERGSTSGAYPGAAYRYTMGYTRTDGLTYSVSTRPTLTVQNNTGVVAGGKAVQFWEVQINNTGLVTAPYTWMALEKGSGGVDVDSVVLTPSGVKLTPTSFGSNAKWYGVAGSSGLVSQSNQKARVYFRYTSCSADSIKMTAGFSCGAYPSPDPSAMPCGVQQFLNVVPQLSEIQLSVSRQPGAGSPVGMCSADSTTIIINSAQAANLVSPVLRAYPPAGMTIASPVQVEFPLGSGAWQAVAATAVSGGYEIQLSGHTGIGSAGMAGTLTTSTASLRQAKVKLTFTADCSFVSGRRLVVYGYGQRPCGGSAVGEGQNIKTSAVTIAGASTGGATMSLSISAPSTLAGGDTSTIVCTGTPGGSATVSGDTVTYTIPAGLTYAGGFTPGGSCAGCAAVISAGVANTTMVKVQMPVGVSAGTAIGYSFKVSAQGAGCGTVTIDAEAARTIAGISCGGTTCSGSSAVIGTGSGSVACLKPMVVLNDLSVLWMGNNYIPGATVPMRLMYTNNGTQAVAANKYTVEFFCSPADASPFHTAVLPGPVAISGSKVDTFSVPVSISCLSGQNVTARLQPVMASGATQPLCAPSFASASISLPLELLRFNVALVGGKSSLTWAVANERAVTSYRLERSDDGATFYAIGTAQSRGASGTAEYKQYDETLPASTKIYYRVQVVGTDGTSRASNVASVRQGAVAAAFSVIPNPASTYIQLDWTSAENGMAHINILNAVGVKVFSRPLPARKGANRTRLDDVARMPQGTYMLQLAEGGRVQYARFTVVR